MSPVILFVLFLGWNYLATELLPEFVQGYGIVLNKVWNELGTVDLDVYARDQGTAEIEVKFSIKEGEHLRDVASGKRQVTFEAGEIRSVTISITVASSTGSVNYNYVDTSINGKSVSWRKSDRMLKIAQTLNGFFPSKETTQHSTSNVNAVPDSASPTPQPATPPAGPTVSNTQHVVVTVDGKELSDAEAQEVMDEFIEQSREQTAKTLSEIAANQMAQQRREMLDNLAAGQNNLSPFRNLSSSSFTHVGGGSNLFRNLSSSNFTHFGGTGSNQLGARPNQFLIQSEFNAKHILGMYADLAARTEKFEFIQGEKFEQDGKIMRIIEGGVKIIKDAEGQNKMVAIERSATLFLTDEEHVGWTIKVNKEGMVFSKKKESS